MLTNNHESVEPKYKLPTHFDCKLSAEHKRKLSHFLLEKCILKHTGSKPLTIRTKDATTFIMEVSSHSESIAVIVLDKITRCNL